MNTNNENTLNGNTNNGNTNNGNTNNEQGGPEYFSATAGDSNGEINLHWDPVAGAKYYIIQASRGKDKWKEIDIINKSIYTASQLKSGKQYSFRVAAVSSEGQGKWSEAVAKKSP